MLLSAIMKIASALQRGLNTQSGSSKTPSAPARNNAPAPSAQAIVHAAPQSRVSQGAGVVFDLSNAALQAVAASQGAATPAQTPPASENPSSFLPAMTIAAQNAALAATGTAASNAAPASTADKSTLAAANGGMAGQPVAEAAKAPVTAAARTDAPADPDEEARARALAIQAQERGRLQNLVEELAGAKTATLAMPKALAEETAPDGKPAGLAA